MKQTLKQVLTQTKVLESIEGSRFGTITKIDNDQKIWIDYAGNPYFKPVLAKLGTPWIEMDELKLFQNRIEAVKIDFMDGNPAKPIIRDLLFSAVDVNRSNSKCLKNDVLEIEAGEIILKGQKKVTIKCGNVQTVYEAESSEITQKADTVNTEARINNKIKGGTIHLN